MYVGMSMIYIIITKLMVIIVSTESEGISSELNYICIHPYKAKPWTIMHDHMKHIIITLSVLRIIW